MLSTLPVLCANPTTISRIFPSSPPKLCPHYQHLPTPSPHSQPQSTFCPWEFDDSRDLL